MTEISHGFAYAFIAPSVTILAALIGSIINEAYKRHRDKIGLAAALAGEISTHVNGLQNAWVSILDKWISTLQSGNPLLKSSFDRPIDRVYNDCVSKLGLLPSQVVSDIVYFYESISGFRNALVQILGGMPEYQRPEDKARVQLAMVLSIKEQVNTLYNKAHDSILPSLKEVETEMFGFSTVKSIFSKLCYFLLICWNRLTGS